MTHYFSQDVIASALVAVCADSLVSEVVLFPRRRLGDATLLLNDDNGVVCLRVKISGK